MAGHRPWKEIRDRHVTPERQRANDAEVKRIIAEMPLHELRRARAFSQVSLARTMEVTQPSISRIENEADIYVGTLRDYVQAMNGRLRIVAEFPEGSYEISQFADIGQDDEELLEA